MRDITTYIKDVLKTLRELKKSSGLAFEMLKLLSVKVLMMFRTSQNDAGL